MEDPVYMTLNFKQLLFFNNFEKVKIYHQIKKPTEILDEYWGYPAFRPLQEEIIQSVLDKNDTLALMPTGGGKSICFQVPGLMLDGICIVVSPLIALMKDQVYNLQKRAIPAVAIYSGMRYQDIDRILDNCVYGNIKFLYLSPERLQTEITIERIKKMKVNLLAIDEAHCISQWGYDFRPPYLQISEIREWMPDTPVMALTATATENVVVDIQEKLEFKKGKVFQKSYARSNLAYVVRHTEHKLKELHNILTKVNGSAVVYVRNRRKTKEIAYFLSKQKIRADFYHAGLTSEDRSRKQEAWINNKIRVMVSTNAFGMGIDKPDVRVVVHIDLPDSLEAYFQEAGRAGRDGAKAYAVLLFQEEDAINLERNYELSYPEMSVVRKVYRALGSYFQLALGAGKEKSFDFDILDFSETFKLKIGIVYSCLKLLEQGGWIIMTEAIFTPATLKVNISKEGLYDYLLRNPKLEKIIKTILRTYQGAFNNYVNIHERKLASFLKLTHLDLVTGLEKMKQEKVIEYFPKKDKPQIIFKEERIDADNISLDQGLYSFRKDRHLQRIKKSIDYAMLEICRSRQLLAYFGESEVEACGVCDVCLERKRSGLDDNQFDRYRSKILRMLKKEALSLEQVVDSFAPKRKDLILETLTYLIDEGVLINKEEKLLINDK